MTTTIVVLLTWYFTPWIIALMRGHRNKYAILTVNLFFGWTLIGWAIALAWALTDNVPSRANG
jgi:hypothetical protein